MRENLRPPEDLVRAFLLHREAHLRQLLHCR